MTWPKPKRIVGDVTYYVTYTNGTTVNSGVAGEKMVTAKRVTLKHWPLYIYTDLNRKGAFAVAIRGLCVYIPHRIHVCCNKRLLPLLVIEVQFGWLKIWWRPWEYLHFRLIEGGRL
jgi:hypothetical protein